MSGQIHKCSRCGVIGHNARTCKREPAPPIAPAPASKPPTSARGPGPGSGATEVPAISVDPARVGRFAAIEAAARTRRARGD